MNTKGLETYWQRVAANLCIECGAYPPKAPHLKRCVDCLERVKEYNKNRRGNPKGAGRLTYRGRQKIMPTVLGAIEKLGGQDDGIERDDDGAIVGIPVLD